MSEGRNLDLDRILSNPGFSRAFDAVVRAHGPLISGFLAIDLLKDPATRPVFKGGGFDPDFWALHEQIGRMSNSQEYWEYLSKAGGFLGSNLEDTGFRDELEDWYAANGIDLEDVIDTERKLVVSQDIMDDVLNELSGYQVPFLKDTLDIAASFGDSINEIVAEGPEDDRVQFGIATGLLAMRAAGLWHLNRSNPAYQGLPGWQKDLFWHFFVPRGDGEVTHFLMPRSWEIGLVATLAERAAELVETANRPSSQAKAMVNSILFVEGLSSAPVRDLDKHIEAYIKRWAMVGLWIYDRLGAEAKPGWDEFGAAMKFYETPHPDRTLEYAMSYYAALNSLFDGFSAFRTEIRDVSGFGGEPPRADGEELSESGDPAPLAAELDNGDLVEAEG